MSPTNLRLHIGKVNNLPHKSSSKPPNAFLEIDINGSRQRTKTVSKSINPSWNEDFQLPGLELNSVLSLRVQHESRWSKSLLCGVDIPIGNLLENYDLAQEIKLCLSNPKSNVDLPQGQPQITFRITSQKHVPAGAEVIADARRTLQARGLSDATRETQDESIGTSTRRGGAHQPLAMIVSKLDAFVKVVDETAKIHPYSYLVWQVTSSVYQIIKGQLDRDSAIIDLLSTMEQTFGFVDVIEVLPEKIALLDDTIKDILRQTFECALYIREYAQHGFRGRIHRQLLSNSDEIIESFRLKFVELKGSFDSGVAINTALVSFRNHQKLDTLIRMQTLRKLQPVAMDSSGHTECLPNTRRDVLEHITDWITNPQNEHNVLWLHGLAGSGKSTISTSIANLFRDLNRLGAFVFFSRDVKKRSDPATVVRTLAYQLGSFDPRLGATIAANIDATPSITQAPIAFQFSKLLVGPLTSLEVLLDEGPIVLILDGLDECGNTRTRRELISVLAEEITKLPAFVRTIVTSRAELDIRNAFDHMENACVIGLETMSDVAHSDIMSYFRYHMARIRADNKVLKLTPNWPGSRKLRALCDRACGLFIWASTAVFFIEEGHDPEERIGMLLQVEVSSDAESALDILYTKALQSAALTDSTFISDFHVILGTIVCAKDPLTHSAIDHLLALDKRRPSLHTLSRLGCVLECSMDTPVRVLHPSFADFLSNPRRCRNTAWLINPSSCNFMLASQCLDRLEETLRRNLYNFTLSLSKVDADLPEHIAYACVFWIDHVCMVNEELTPISHRVEKFLFQHLLHWLEAMSILKRSWISAELLTRIAEWARISAPHRVCLSQLINDAIMCTQSYPNFISSHPLLIYESVLPLLPTNSTIYQTFHDPSLFPWVAGGFEESYPPPLQKVLSGHDRGVQTVVFSPDGLRIVSCADDGTVRVWDHTSGMECMTPLRGHEDQVFSVCFSPDGTHIISGSKDRTIRIWDVHRREQNQPPLRGHTGSILSVATAPDGRRILSGSEDMTIRLWDAEASTQSLPPLQGHNDWVWSVCFSPDGMQILSGSEDNTVRLWDSVSRTCLAVMEGHHGAVMSVAFAPDGLSVASGSIDRTIRLWRLFSSGEEVVPWASVHTGPVLSVSFSPDGKHIASASIDTIRLWDVKSGAESSTSLRGGHSDLIHSLAFSPSGRSIVSGSADRTICVWNMALIGMSEVQDTRLCTLACSPNGAIVVSGSQDHTLRVWDAATGKEIRGPLRGHTDAISSVSFSPDGTRFASGAQDMTVCVWDVTTGSMALGPLKGPKSASLFVAFSADGAKVTACSEDGIMFTWDATTGTCLSTLPHSIDHSCRYRGPIEVTDDAWIVEVATGNTLSRLPRTISTVTTVSQKTMIAIGTLSGRLIVMHFPAGAKLS